MNILFLCTANVQRSKTAEELFQVLYPENTYKSAGLSAKYVTKAGSTLCTEGLLKWADKIYVFEQAHIERIEQYTKSRYVHKVTNLDIPDEYCYFQKELVLMLIERLAKR
ncbi:hypothetical protein [Pseudoalteromonas sp. APC 3250]|uniref:hypothetical protein n=1 Tax=Pseudoalteromonas sp. APC 3250 TaxID=3035184 RepID=UPI0025B41472|nr:hypothetical protein [Pseudoalteromonas sp. APC 3250]MDN3414502.1 hypothetical protein [Pseudoalteromonas sp. APC 3250]